MNNIIDFLKKIYRDSLLQNSSYLLVGNIFSNIIGFFFWVIATRYYTPNDIGIISAILSSIGLVSMISLVGLPGALMFYLPRNIMGANRIINSCMTISIIISAMFSLVYVLGVKTWIPGIQYIMGNFELIVILVITTTVTNISAIVSSIFTANKRSSFHLIKENIFAIVKIFLIILFSGFGAIGILMSWTAGIIIATVTGLFLLFRFKLWKYTSIIVLDPIIKTMVNFSIAHYIAGIFYNLPRLLIPIIIVNLISAEFAGYFFIAMTIASLLYSIPMSVVGPFWAESPDEKKFWNNVHKAIKFNICLLIPGLIAFIIFGKFILNILNPSYAEHSFTTLIILSVTSIPYSLIAMYNIIRNAQNKIMIPVIINGIVATTTLLASVYFVKIWSIEGVAMAYFIANMAVAIAIIIRTENPAEFTLRLIKGNKNVSSI